MCIGFSGILDSMSSYEADHIYLLSCLLPQLSPRYLFHAHISHPRSSFLQCFTGTYCFLYGAYLMGLGGHLEILT